MGAPVGTARNGVLRLARGDDDAGPYQSPMEDGMQHFHEWYQQRMHRQPPQP